MPGVFRPDWFPPKRRRVLSNFSEIINLTGVSATSAVGTPAVDYSSNIDLVGNSATSAVGDLVAQANDTVDLVGVQANSAVGVPQALRLTDVNVVGVESTSAEGTFALHLTQNPTLSGDHVTSSVGTFGFDLTTQFDLTGVQSTSGVGHFALGESSAINLVGVTAVSEVGSTDVIYPVFLTGVEATSAAGQVAETIGVPLTGVHATSSVGGFRQAFHLDGVFCTSEVGTISNQGEPSASTFFIASTTELLAAPGSAMYPTSDVIDLGSTAYVVGSSQFYTIGQVSWGDTVRTQGVDWEFVAPFTHIIEILNLPAEGTPITLLYVKWNIGVTAGFEVTSYPVPFSFINMTIVAEALPPAGDYFSINFINTRALGNPQTLFTLYPIMVDDMLSSHTLFDSPNGFQTFRPDCYQVVDTSDWNVWEWEGSYWVVINSIPDGTSFYVKSLRQIYENQSGVAVLKYTAGDGTNVDFPEALTYPAFGEGVGKNLLVDGFSGDAESQYPAAYAICNTPGSYDPVCADEDAGFDEEFDYFFDGP